MKKKFFSILRFTFFLGIGIFFIWLFLRNLTSTEKHEIIYSLKNANYFWIIIVVFIGIFSHYIRAIRWRMLLEPLGYQPRKANVFFSVFIGYLANMVLPRLGEVSRCGVLTRYEKIPFNKGFGTVITERAVDMVVFFLIFFVNTIFQASRLYSYIEQKVYQPFSVKFNHAADFSGSIKIIIFSGLILLVVLFFLFRKKIIYSRFYTKIKTMLLGFLEGIKSLMGIKKPRLFIFYSLLIWFCYLLMSFLVFFAMPATKQLGLDAGISVLIFGTIGIMLVQGGIGIYPAIVAETLFIYGIPEVSGYAMGWLIWISQTITILIIGPLSTILLPIYNKHSYGKN
ncbi:MAG: flippase-like domain-containing protein [Lentimicrobiaceae bacterium]|nr:flippase-like domain-containing protein [Lentimicrobiaceae bacterium]